MQLAQCPRDREPETGALVLPCQMAFDLLEWLEHPVKVLRGDADARVDDGDNELTAIANVGGDGDAAAGLGELDRIRQQGQQDLLEPALVDQDRAVGRTRLHAELNLLLLRVRGYRTVR